MPDITPVAADKLQQMHNRLNDLMRKNTAAMRDAAKRSQNATGAARAQAQQEFFDLKQARRDLIGQSNTLLDLEHAYEQSTRAANQAQADLAAAASDATQIVRDLQNAAQVLQAVTRFANLLTRVIALFP